MFVGNANTLKKWRSLFLTFFMAFKLNAQSSTVIYELKPSEKAHLSKEAIERKQRQACSDLINWIYKSMTAKTIEQSFDRATKKLLLAYLHLYKNAKKQPKLRLKFLKLSKSLKQIDPDFEYYVRKSPRLGFSKWWNKRKLSRYKGTNDFHTIISEWKELQEHSPELFSGLHPYLFLDSWDVQTSGIMDHINSLGLKDSKIKELKKKFSKPNLVLQGKIEDPYKIENDLKQVLNKLNDRVSEIFEDEANDYQKLCPKDVLESHLKSNNISCLIKKDSPHKNVELFLKEISNILTPANLKRVAPPKEKNEKIKVQVPKYNVNKDANYCLRPTNIIDTIVIHHTATRNSATPNEINDTHLERNKGGKWYMVGYNFLVRDNPSGKSTNKDIYQGRPPEMVGSHAGGNTKKLPKKKQDELSKVNLSCGSDKNGFTPTRFKQKINSDGTTHGNNTTIGIAVIGNFAPKRYKKISGVVVVKNETGYEPANPRYPSDYTLKKIAKLACSLQQKYPNIKHIRPHKYYAATACPGNVHARFEQIVRYAKEYGCDF